MATITLPSSPGFRSMRPIYNRATRVGMSPYNFTQQVYSSGGKLKVVEFGLPPLTADEFDDWRLFIDQLDGHINTFNVDLSDAYPGESGLTSVAMRLVDSQQEWDVNEALHYGMTFTAMEAK